MFVLRAVCVTRCCTCLPTPYNYSMVNMPQNAQLVVQTKGTGIILSWAFEERVARQVFYQSGLHLIVLIDLFAGSTRTQCNNPFELPPFGYRTSSHKSICGSPETGSSSNAPQTCVTMRWVSGAAVSGSAVRKTTGACIPHLQAPWAIQVQVSFSGRYFTMGYPLGLKTDFGFCREGRFYCLVNLQELTPFCGANAQPPCQRRKNRVKLHEPQPSGKIRTRSETTVYRATSGMLGL